MTITESGIYDIPADQYHADPCPEPSLSGSLAVPLVNRSPRHAWWKHPRLNPNHERTSNIRFEFGTVAHALLLGKGGGIEVIEADSFTTKAAREARDAARTAGKTPVLADDYERAQAMAMAANKFLADSIGELVDGAPEMTLAWKEGDIWCRGMVDWLCSDLRMVLDYKTTSASARPEDAERSLYDLNYHVKAAFYERGLDVLDPPGMGRRKFWFLFQETEPPFECSLLTPSEGGMTIGRKQITYAIRRWQQCMSTGQWPGYGIGIHQAQLPSWIERAWLERETNDPFATGDLAPGGRVEPYDEKPFGGWTP